MIASLSMGAFVLVGHLASQAETVESDEGLRMAEAFRRENVDPNFDWAAYYGRGVHLHLRSPMAPQYGPMGSPSSSKGNISCGPLVCLTFS